MPSTAFAISLAAKNIERLQLTPAMATGKTQKILVLQDQMCSAVYPWQDVCDRSNGKVKLMIVQYPAMDQTWTELVVDTIRREDEVAVACLPPLHWSDGALLDLVAIGEECRTKCISLIVDATQAVGASALDRCSVKQIRPSLLACSVHKWLRSPSGASLVYIDPKLHEQWSPLDQHGRGRDLEGGTDWDASRDEMGPNGYPEKFFKDARKFDSGGKPNSILLPMLRTSLEHVAVVDKQHLQSTLKDLMSPFLEWVRGSANFQLPVAHDYHLFGVRPAKMTPEKMIEICNRLEKEKKVFIVVRCGAFRIAPYLDNCNRDVEKLLTAFEEMERHDNSSLSIQ
jgi:selenocysteine lyase/cysteine desulfurase